jgi:hypothetical protein
MTIHLEGLVRDHYRKIARVVHRWRSLLVAGLILLGAIVVILNFWKYLYSMNAGLHDYGRIEHFVLTTAYGDPVPMKNPEDGSSHLGIHFHLVLFLVSALNSVLPWDHLYGLAMALCWYGAVIGLGVLVHRLTGRLDLAILMATGFFFNMYMRRLLFSGHYEHIQAGCEIMAAIAAVRGSWPAFAAWILVGATVREDVPLYLLGFIAYQAVTSRTVRGRKASIAVGIACLVYFAVAMKLLMPWVGGMKHAVLLQANWGRGDSIRAVLLNLLSHPKDLLGAFVNKETYHVLQSLLFLPLLVPYRFLVYCVGPITVMGLTTNPFYRGFYYYASAPFIGLCAIAAAFGVARLCQWRHHRLARWLLVVNILMSLNMCWRDRLAEGRPKPHWPYGLTLAAQPFPVTARARRVVEAVHTYPSAGRIVAADFYTFTHVPFSRERWFLNPANLRERKPDLVFLDEVNGIGETLILSQMSSLASLRRLLAIAGYDRHELTDKCFVYVRRTPTENAKHGKGAVR